MAFFSMGSVDVLEDLICSICLEVFKEPVILECGHNYCKSCIDKAWGSEGNPQCPECRTLCLGRRYTANRVLQRIAEKRHILDLEQLADTFSLTPRVPQPEINLKRAEQLCEVHMEELKLFCEVCESSVCLICRDSRKHTGHRFLPLQEAEQLLLPKYKDELKTMSSALQSQLKYIRELQNKQEQKKINTVNDTHVLEQHVTSEFAKLYQFLREEEEQLIKRLKEEEMVILEEVERRLEKIQEKADIIQRTISKINLWLQQQELEQLALLKDTRNLIAKILEEMSESDDSNQRLGTFRGPLLYTVWKKMNSIITPVPSPLLLDPETANGHLVLSDDLRSVRYSSTHQQYHVDPKRFTAYFAVLGFDGVTTGRHYWEVVVENKNEWNIGVVWESIKRKINTEKKPENGFWSLYLREYNTLMAMDSHPRVLKLKVKPRKLGVYLDYEGGQVSFYDAGNMSHLYTFTDTFTDTLYLYLNPCDNEFEPNLTPLKLFHLKL